MRQLTNPVGSGVTREDATTPCDTCQWPCHDNRDGLGNYCTACILDGKAWGLQCEADDATQEAAKIRSAREVPTTVLVEPDADQDDVADWDLRKKGL